MRMMVLLGALALAACGDDIATGIESANDLLYSDKFVESERLYRKLLRRLEAEAPRLSDKEESQRLLVLDRLGKLNALYLHDYDQAIRYYKQLVMLYPRTSQAFAGLATIADILQHKLGKHEAAIEAYQKMVQEFPTDESLSDQDQKLRSQEQTRAQLRIANAYFALKNYPQARSEAEKLINLWPSSSEAAQARFQIANSYYLEGRYAEAVATYEKLLEGEPDATLVSLVLFELGNCFQELDQADRALAYYYGCLTDHPDPLLVQKKLKRLRKRIGSERPADSIHIPSYLKDRLAAVRALPFGVTTDAPAEPRVATQSPAGPKPAAVPNAADGAPASPPVEPRPAAAATATATEKPAAPAPESKTEPKPEPPKAAETPPPKPKPEPATQPAAKPPSKPAPESAPPTPAPKPVAPASAKPAPEPPADEPPTG